MVSLFRQVYALLFCWLALSSQPFSMALNTRLTLSTSGKRSLRAVAANRLEARSEKFAEALSGWHMGMLEAAVCRENCDELFESAKSQGVTFLEEAKSIDRVTPDLLKATMSVVSTSLSDCSLPVPETLKESFDSIFEHGYSSPPLAPVFEKQLHHVWEKFETSEIYKSQSVSKWQKVHQLLHQLLSDRLAPLDDKQESSGEIEKPHTVSSLEEDEYAVEHGMDIEQAAEKQESAVLHSDKHKHKHLHKHMYSYALGRQENALRASGAEVLLLQVESNTRVIVGLLLYHYMSEAVQWYLDNSGPYGLYGFTSLLFFAFLLKMIIRSSEPTNVVPPIAAPAVHAELQLEGPQEEEAEEEEEEEATKDAPRCAVCWEKPIDVYSSTCRHYAMCSTCAARLTPRLCPVCRAPLGAMEHMPWPKYKLIQSLFVNGKDN